MAPSVKKAGLAVCCIALLQIGVLDFSVALVEDDAVSDAGFLDKRNDPAQVGESDVEESPSAPFPGEGPEGEPLPDGPDASGDDDDEGGGESDELLGAAHNLVRRLMGLESPQAKNLLQQLGELESVGRRLSEDDLEDSGEEEPGMSGEPGGEGDDDLGLESLFGDQDKADVGGPGRGEEDRLIGFLNSLLSQLGVKEVSEEDLKQMLQSAMRLIKESGIQGAGEGLEGGLEGRRLSAGNGRHGANTLKFRSGISEGAKSSDHRPQDAAVGSTDAGVTPAEGGYDEATERVKAAARDMVKAMGALLSGLGGVVSRVPLDKARAAAGSLAEKVAQGGKVVKQKTQDASTEMINGLRQVLERASVALARTDPQLAKLAVEVNKEMEKEIKNVLEEDDSLG